MRQKIAKVQCNKLLFLLSKKLKVKKIARIAKDILGDPGADSGGKRKSKREGKYGTKKSKERREGSLLFFVPYFPARLDFLLPPLPAPGSPRVGQNLIGEFTRKIYAAS